MPRIDWPQQPRRVCEACARQGVDIPPEVGGLLSMAAAPTMGATEAKAFLRCFYAARDLERAERDLAAGGGATGEFASAALARRRDELRQRLHELEAMLCKPRRHGA
jgi:hypothetical protein